jgi:hypothetical protein
VQSGLGGIWHRGVQQFAGPHRRSNCPQTKLHRHRDSRRRRAQKKSEPVKLNTRPLLAASFQSSSSTRSPGTMDEDWNWTLWGTLFHSAAAREARGPSRCRTVGRMDYPGRASDSSRSGRKSCGYLPPRSGW